MITRILLYAVGSAVVIAGLMLAPPFGAIFLTQKAPEERKAVATLFADGLGEALPLQYVADFVASNLSRNNTSLYLAFSQEVKFELEKDRLLRLKQAEAGINPGAFEDNRTFRKAAVRLNQQSSQVKIRIKGDRKIHYINPLKPSYRIKTKRSQPIHGMTKFSIHHSGSRNYLAELEWLEMLREFEVITPQYFHTTVSINDIDYGVYAVEEYPSKYTLERNGRREGPILRFDEHDPAQHVDVISSQNELKLAINQQAVSKLQGFREGRLALDDVFNSRLWGAFYAVSTLVGGEHGLLSKSLRFYYNPITRKIEPIPFDGHPGILKPIFFSTELGRGVSGDWTSELWGSWLQLFFQRSGNEAFVRAYLETLNEIVADGWLEDFYLDKSELFKAQLALIQSTFPLEDRVTDFFGPSVYTYSQDRVKGRRQVIKQRIAESVVAYSKHPSDNESLWFTNASGLAQLVLFTECEDYPYVREYVIPSRSRSGPGSKVVTPGNGCKLSHAFKGTDYAINPSKHSEPIENHPPPFRKQVHTDQIYISVSEHLTALNFTGKSASVTSILCGAEAFELKKTMLLNNSAAVFGEGWDRTEILLESPQEISRLKTCRDPILLKTEDDTAFSTKVIIDSPSTEALRRPDQDLLMRKYFNISNDVISLREEKTIFNEPVYVPAGFQVEVYEGQDIDLVNGAFLYSESPVRFMGSEKSPINVTSSDSSGRGLIVISQLRSMLAHSNFSNLASIEQPDWSVTGALTFYGGEIDITQIRINNVRAEDGLNIVRGRVKIDKLSISKVESDGFDCDFCTGDISDSRVEFPGNDGFDFSGSTLSLTNVTVFKVGDKAISVGEGSQVKIRRAVLGHGAIGVASKDSSLVEIHDSDISDFDYALSAYQKKPEFGGGKIIAVNVKTPAPIYEGLKSKVQIGSVR